MEFSFKIGKAFKMDLCDVKTGIPSPARSYRSDLKSINERLICQTKI